MTSRSEKLHGIILKRSNFGEADKLLTIFSQSKGKIKVVAKGIRKIKSRRAPHLELFNEVELILHHGKTFDIVTEAKVVNDFAKLKSDLKFSGYLFYLSEIIDRILPEHQPHSELFSSYLSCLSHLSNLSGSLDKQAEGQVKEFVVNLLWGLGYLPKGDYPKLGVTSTVEEIIEKPIRSKKFLEEI